MADQQFRALSSCLVIAFLMVKVTAEKNGAEEDCLSPLGMEDGRIKDDQLRASSFLNDQSQAANSRLNHQDGYGGWCPNQTASGIRTGPFHYNQYILVTLNMPVRIKGVATQGRYNGEEKVDHYWIGFKPHIRTKRLGMVPDEQKPIKFFEGNINSEMHTNILKPSIVVKQICIIPEVNKDKQVCMRFELLGCPLKYGLVSYTIPQGNTREGRYNFTDSSYDGFTKGHFLSDGIGMLTDGKLAPADYVDNSGLGWIGWNAKDTPKPYIIFEFLNTRIFRAMTLHCNVRDTAKIKLFSKVKVRFSMDGGYSSKSIVYNTLNVSSGSSWINYNVTIDLNQRTGKLMKLEFSYTAGQWILISEVTFQSVQTDLRLPATTTRPTTQRQQDISTAYGPTTTSGTVEKEANGLTSREITIVSAFGSAFFVVVAALIAIFFMKFRAGRRPNIPDDSDEEEIQPYATVRLSKIFPLNDESNDPGNNDIPLETLPSQLRTPQEERATGRTEPGNSPYENTDHLGESSVTLVEYLFYEPRYENETVDSESRNVVIRPGYDKLTPATSQPREYDSLIRETNLNCTSRRGDIIDAEGEDNMNIHTRLEVPSSFECTLACSMDKKEVISGANKQSH